MVAEHETICRCLETMVCFDQPNIANLSGCEMLCRRLQLIEKNYKYKLGDAETRRTPTSTSVTPGAPGASSASNRCSRTGSAKSSRKETFVMMERRKAGEKRPRPTPEV